MNKTISKRDLLFELIRANPYISQQELAQQLQLSRSAVAGYVANLTKDGRILGRAYVLPDGRPIICIGGANIDRKLRSKAPLQMGTSNPVSQDESFGGVARNIAENLARLGSSVRLLCAVGDDGAGQSLLAQADSVGIDVSASLQVKGELSGSYTALLSDTGDLVLAMAHMELCEALTPAFLLSRQQQRANAVLTVVDMNLPSDSIQLLIDEAKQNQHPLVIVAVSQPKMARLPEQLSGIRLLILNQGELEQRSGRVFAHHEEIIQAGRHLQSQGVQDVIVTLGAEGVLFSNSLHRDDWTFCKAEDVGAAEVADVTGAGDAFTAGVCWSLNEVADDIFLACQRGLKMAAITVRTTTTVAQTLHPSLFNEETSCNPI
ncbi:carbohydrate kinase family protein [Undibacterium jejuense]|uniref:Carbohydrate kinase family protein n=1 Tax=Undibacterium jejuense TaxID=1344949 RepID=A0A923HGA4_9BURK|nr:carbohydrate kinase family protein [Undibacterium jejuense]MBC3861077.1 carbohydrate kinase family protein [Undibacterium jejuense]